MKFWQRFIILCSTSFLTLTYIYIYSSEKAYVHVNHARMLEAHLWPLPPHNLSTSSDEETCHFKITPHSRPNISTYELYQATFFNLNPDGSYEMPSAAPNVDIPSEEDGLPLLNVIVVPHSHLDPGWLKTVDEYYVDQTKHILTNMVNKLTEYPNMTFVMAESVFFHMWWNELEDAVKVHVRRLVRRGQLEIVLGGWVMPDEASTHYVSVIDQLVEGHQWVWENLGVKPENSWSIDPFGYSGTMPYLWKKAGMDNMVIQRVHQSIKGSLISLQSLEFNWRQYWDNKGTTDIQCHIMPYMLYNIKHTCGPNHYICLLFDFRSIPHEASETRAKPITSANLEKHAKYLYEQYRKKSYLFKYDTILVPIGDDFRYNYKIEWDQQYQNYATLMEYMNSKEEWKINMKFGTLKDYFKIMNKKKAVKKLNERNGALPILSGDFFPYSDQNNEYWSGYFTTRPFDKTFSRDVQQHIQAADILNTLTYAYFKKWKMHDHSRFFKYSSLLQQARRAHGLFLHHDAITGTAKEYVVVDYENRLAEAYNATQNVMAMAMQALISRGHVESPIVFKPETVRRQFNEEPVKQTIQVKDSGTIIVFFNSLAQHRQEVVRIITDTDHVLVKNSNNKAIPCQINPVWEDTTLVSANKFEVMFIVELAPFAISPYTILKRENLDGNLVFPAKLSMFNTDEMIVPPDALFYQSRPQTERVLPIVVENNIYRLVFQPTKGSLQEVFNKATGNKTYIDLEFLAYKSRGSGAYIFYPEAEAKPIFYHNIPIVRVIEGPIASQIHVIFKTHLKHTVTIYNHPPLQATGIHISNTLNMKPFKDKEIIMRIKSSIKNVDLSYFTDQNGYQLIRRKTNTKLRTEANYYPMTSMGMLEDDHQRLTLHSGQSHGVSGLQAGWFEVMLDRQTVYDDNRGLQETVEDNKPVTSEFVLMIEQRKGINFQKNFHYALPSLLSVCVGDLLQTPVTTYYSQVDSSVFHESFSPLAAALPCDTSVTSLRSLVTQNLVYNDTSLILHRRGYDCAFPSDGVICSLSDNSLSLAALLKDFPPNSIRETTLTHLYEKEVVKPHSPLKTSQMELTSYLIHW